MVSSMPSDILSDGSRKIISRPVLQKSIYVMLFCSLLNMNKYFSIMSFSLCLSHILLGQYFEKKYQKWGFGKQRKRGVVI